MGRDCYPNQPVTPASAAMTDLVEQTLGLMFSALSRAKECNPNVRLCEAGLRPSSDGSLTSSSPRNTRMLWRAEELECSSGCFTIAPDLDPPKVEVGQRGPRRGLNLLPGPFPLP